MCKFWILAVSCVTLVTCPGRAFAQTIGTADSARRLSDNCLQTAAPNDPLHKLVDLALDRGASLTNRDVVWGIIHNLVADRLLANAQELRFDKQVTANAGDASQTSLVSKATAAVLGIAVEYGGIARTVDGTTVTLSTKPLDAIRQGIMRMPFLEGTTTSCNSRWLRALGGLSLSATFLRTSRTRRRRSTVKA